MRKPTIGYRQNVSSKKQKSSEEYVAPISSPKKNPIHSIVTTLPVIMLMVGLWFYYSGEKKQRGGEPVMAELVSVTGVFSGTSEQNTNPGAQRILWIKTVDRLRGGRLDLNQYKLLQSLKKDQMLEVWMAPRVRGSNTLWVLKVMSDEQTIIDQLPQQ